MPTALLSIEDAETRRPSERLDPTVAVYPPELGAAVGIPAILLLEGLDSTWAVLGAC